MLIAEAFELFSALLEAEEFTLAEVREIVDYTHVLKWGGQREAVEGGEDVPPD